VLLTFVVLPVLSLVATSWSYYLGATLLVGSGFLMTYTLVSRSEPLLGIERGYAVRLVLAELFALLALMAAGGVISILLLQEGVFTALIIGYDLTDPWLRMLTVDMEVFYLARPVLLALVVALAAAGVAPLFKESFQSITRPIVVRVRKEKLAPADRVSVSSSSRSGRKLVLGGLFPYLILVASVILAIAITTYPYTVAKVDRPLGSDMWLYEERLRVMMKASNPLSALEADRGFFVLVLFAMSLTRIGIEPVVMLTPPLCSSLLALSAFALIKEGTGRPWLAALAAVLSVVSAQTSLGMGAGIMANWFALSFANFTFALVIRSARLHSKLASAASIVLSVILLWSYSYMWVVAIGILALAVAATLLSFRSGSSRGEWKYEATFLVAALAGTLALPLVLAGAVVPLLGYRSASFEPRVWLDFAWNYLGKTRPAVLALAPFTLEQAFDFAGNRIDLPVLTVVSIVGLLDSRSEAGSFRKIVAAMVLVPIVLAVTSPGLYETWRGLYVIPMYLTAALGVEGIIHRVNRHESPWASRGRLMLAGTFVAYVFLSHLSYSLRALELLILAVHVS